MKITIHIPDGPLCDGCMMVVKSMMNEIFQCKAFSTRLGTEEGTGEPMKCKKCLDSEIKEEN